MLHHSLLVNQRLPGARRSRRCVMIVVPQGDPGRVLPNWFSWKVLIELSSTVEDGLMPVPKKRNKNQLHLGGDWTGKLLYPWDGLAPRWCQRRQKGTTVNDLHINLSGDSKWPLCVWMVRVCVCVCGTCLSRVFVGRIQVYFPPCFTVWLAEFCRIRARRRLFLRFRVFTNVQKRGGGEEEYSAADWWRERVPRHQ